MTPLVIAHRGDSARRPENTLASFASALETGAEILEFDVQRSADGHAVVIHDATVDRTTNGRGRVAELNLPELRALSAGYPARFGSAYVGERIPVLSEVLGLARERARALIEIKPEAVTGDAEGGIEAQTVADVRKAGMEKDVIFISFSRLALLRCRTLAPEIPRGHLFHQGATGDILAGAREVGCDLVLPEKRLLSEDLKERAREAGVKVATWVVDDPDELKQLLRFDLYGIGSNRPGEMLEAIQDLAR